MSKHPLSQVKQPEQQLITRKHPQLSTITTSIPGCLLALLLSHIPLQVVDLVCVLAFLTVLLIGLVDQDLHAFSTTRFIFAGLSHRIQLPYLILEGQRNRSYCQGRILNRCTQSSCQQLFNEITLGSPLHPPHSAVPHGTLPKSTHSNYKHCSVASP